MRGDGGVAGEGRVAGVSKFNSWSKCTRNTNSDWMSNAFSDLCVNLFILCRSFISHLGVQLRQ